MRQRGEGRVSVHDLDRLVDEDPAKEGEWPDDGRKNALVVERNDRKVVDLGKNRTLFGGGTAQR